MKIRIFTMKIRIFYNEFSNILILKLEYSKNHFATWKNHLSAMVSFDSQCKMEYFESLES